MKKKSFFIILVRHFEYNLSLFCVQKLDTILVSTYLIKILMLTTRLLVKYEYLDHSTNL